MKWKISCPGAQGGLLTHRDRGLDDEGPLGAGALTKGWAGLGAQGNHQGVEKPSLCQTRWLPVTNSR